MKWNPIKTAPKGKSILLFYGKEYFVMEGVMRNAKWVVAADMGDLLPTHWMPLPCAP